MSFQGWLLALSVSADLAENCAVLCGVLHAVFRVFVSFVPHGLHWLWFCVRVDLSHLLVKLVNLITAD